MSVFDDLQSYIVERIVLDVGSGCWLWTGGIDSSGYGVYRTNKSSRWNKVHRKSYEAFIGPIPHGFHICHHCDVRFCCNPAHLWAGTQQENNFDMLVKGRAVFPPTPIKAFCSRGHQLNSQNRLGSRGQDCKICHRLRQAKYREQKIAIFPISTPAL